MIEKRVPFVELVFKLLPVLELDCVQNTLVMWSGNARKNLNDNQIGGTEY